MVQQIDLEALHDDLDQRIETATEEQMDVIDHAYDSLLQNQGNVFLVNSKPGTGKPSTKMLPSKRLNPRAIIDVVTSGRMMR